MVGCFVRNHISWMVMTVVIIAVAQCEAKKCGVMCRVRDPMKIGNSQMLKQCLYEIYPVESTQSTDGSGKTLYASDDRRNRLFSLYGGPSSCEYFGTMIQTAKGRDTLVETIRRQLQKSGFKGLDLQCDPVQARVTQQTYAEFMEQLRSFLGNTYVVMVTMNSCQLEPKLVETLNRVADFVTINHVGQVRRTRSSGKRFDVEDLVFVCVFFFCAVLDAIQCADVRFGQTSPAADDTIASLDQLSAEQRLLAERSAKPDRAASSVRSSR